MNNTKDILMRIAIVIMFIMSIVSTATLFYQRHTATYGIVGYIIFIVASAFTLVFYLFFRHPK